MGKSHGRTSKSKKIPVIIRREGKTGALHDLVAIFPAEAGSTDTHRTMLCYSAADAHGSCSTGYIGEKTKPATAAETRAMLKELHRVGYRDLKVVSRASSAHAAERRRQAR